MNQQTTGDLPTITASNYSSSLWSGVSFGADTNNFQLNQTPVDWRQQPAVTPEQMVKQMRRAEFKHKAEQEQIHIMTKRIVRVYLADTDDNVPLAQSLLFSSDEKFTDLTDQELYFEIPIKEVLDKHNALRSTIVNKKATERIGKEIFLDPVKIRDLKMTVVSIATF